MEYGIQGFRGQSSYPEGVALREHSPWSLSVARTVSKVHSQGLRSQNETTPESLLLGIGGRGRGDYQEVFDRNFR